MRFLENWNPNFVVSFFWILEMQLYPNAAHCGQERPEGNQLLDLAALRASACARVAPLDPQNKMEKHG